MIENGVNPEALAVSSRFLFMNPRRLPLVSTCAAPDRERSVCTNKALVLQNVVKELRKEGQQVEAQMASRHQQR